MTSARGISFDHRPSPTLIRLTLGIVALATLAPLFTSLPWIVRGLLAMGVAAYGLHRVAKCRSSTVAGVVWAPDGVWTVADRDGEAWPAELVGSRTVGLSVFLHLRWATGRAQLALLPDNSLPDDLRMLRARLAERG